jgi:hypothetical protein
MTKRTNHRSFADTARLIAGANGGTAPQWLVEGLEYLSCLVDDDGDWDLLYRTVGQMRDAIDVLVQWLPLLELPQLGGTSSDVRMVIPALKRFKTRLDRVEVPKGRRPNVHDEFCAAIILEAWKLVHGKIEPRSERLYEACYAYLWACTGKAKAEWKNPVKWRTPVKRALANELFPRDFARKVLTGYKQEFGGPK